MYNLYDRIRFYCEQEGITPNALFIKLGYSKSTISRLRVGKTKTLSAQILTDIANYFHITVDELLGEPSQELPQSADIKEELIRINRLLENEGIMYDGTPLTSNTKADIKRIMDLLYDTMKSRLEEMKEEDFKDGKIQTIDGWKDEQK